MRRITVQWPSEPLFIMALCFLSSGLKISKLNLTKQPVWVKTWIFNQVWDCIMLFTCMFYLIMHSCLNAFMCIICQVKGFLHTSQISHLLLYPLLWLLVPGLSSQFLPLFPIQLAFDVSSDRQYLWEMATRFCNLREPLYVLRDHTMWWTFFYQCINWHVLIEMAGITWPGCIGCFSRPLLTACMALS